jgi:hypothetical protein
LQIRIEVSLCNKRITDFSTLYIALEQKSETITRTI